jgi:hypothetical protein
MNQRDDRYNTLIRKSEWKRPLRRPRHRQRIIRRLILRKYGIRVWSGPCGSDTYLDDLAEFFK